MAGQSRGKAEPPWAELLRCVHPGEQVPRGPEKGGQGGVQRGADLWARQGRWKDEGGGPTRREKTCKDAAGRDDDPGGLRVWRHLNREGRLAASDGCPPQHRESFRGELGCSQAQGGLGNRHGKDTSRAAPGGFSSTIFGAAWSR